MLTGRSIQRWICAALKFEGAPTTVERLSRLIPAHPEAHHVSQQVYVLKRRGIVEKLGTGARGKPVWKLVDHAFVASDDLLAMVQQIEHTAREPVALYSDRDAVRTEILACLKPPVFETDTKPVRSKQDILRACPSARSEHEVSQILAEMVAHGRVIGEGSGRKRRYWIGKETQMDLFHLCEDVSQAEIEQTEKMLRIVFRKGVVAKRRQAFNGAVLANYDHRGGFLELIVNKEALNVTA